MIDSSDVIEAWLFSASELQEGIEGKRILNPSIDLSNACDLNCPYCFVEEKASTRKVRKPGELTLAETLRVVDDLAACGARTVNIVGAGEPLYDPHFRDVIDAIVKLEMRPMVFTNGTRFTREEELVQFVADRRVSVVIKLNSWDAELQDTVVGRKGYTRVRDTAVRLLMNEGLNASTPTRMGIDTLAFSANQYELPLIHRWAWQNNIYPITADFIPAGRTETGEVRALPVLAQSGTTSSPSVTNSLVALESSELCALHRELNALAPAPLRHRRYSASAYIGGGACSQLLGLYIDISGQIWPCVAKAQISSGGTKRIPLGNIRDGDSIESAWTHSEVMRSLRRNFDGGCPYKRAFS